MPTAHRDGHSIHYEVSGNPDGPPLLFLMGLALSSRAWGALPEMLGKYYRVITLDNRGVGRSAQPKKFFRVVDMADDAIAVLDEIGVRRTAVFGISMGGMIAIELAIKHGDRVRALALGCTHGGYLRSAKPSFSTTRKLIAGAFSKRPDFAGAATFLVSEEYFAKNAEFFAQWLKSAERAPTRPTLMQMFAILRYNAESRLGRISAPTLVLSGDSDKLVPASNSRRLVKSIPNAELVLFEGVGHCFPVERENETAAHLESFFKKSESNVASVASSSARDEKKASA